MHTVGEPEEVRRVLREREQRRRREPDGGEVRQRTRLRLERVARRASLEQRVPVAAEARRDHLQQVHQRVRQVRLGRWQRVEHRVRRATSTSKHSISFYLLVKYNYSYISYYKSRLSVSL